MNPSCHISVMPQEVLHWLEPTSGNTIVDGTLGGGGHTLALAKQVTPGGEVIAVDLDAEAIARVRPQVGQLPIRICQANFSEIPEILAGADISSVDGILLDLGLSSDQLADDERGFSFQAAGELDLRFDPSEGEPAWQLLSYINERSLANLIYNYGEERYSRRIAKRIVEARKAAPIRTAQQLAEIVRACVPAAKATRSTRRRAPSRHCVSRSTANSTLCSKRSSRFPLAWQRAGGWRSSAFIPWKTGS